MGRAKWAELHARSFSGVEAPSSGPCEDMDDAASPSDSGYRPGLMPDTRVRPPAPAGSPSVRCVRDLSGQTKPDHRVRGLTKSRARTIIAEFKMQLALDL